MSDRERKLKAIENYFAPKYDSDKDLPEDKQKEIKDLENYYDKAGAEKVRTEAWEKSGMYPKLKRMVKGGIYGDMRKKKDNS